MDIRARYYFFLPFNIGLLEGTMKEAIDFSIGNAKVSIHPLTFADRPGIADSPELEELGENTREYMERVWGRLTNGEIVLNVNLVTIDIIIDVEGFRFDELEDLEDEYKLDSIFEPVAKTALSRFLEVCRFKTGNARIDYKGVVGRYNKAYHVDDKVFGKSIHGVGILLGDYIGEDELNGISDDLISGYQIPLSKNLFLDARSLLGVKTRRLAIIQVITALEVAVSDLFMNHLCSLGIANDDFVKSMYEFWIRRGGSANILKKAAELLPRNIQENIRNKKLRNQCKKAAELRNKIVHRGEEITEYSPEQIMDILVAVGEMIDYLLSYRAGT